MPRSRVYRCPIAKRLSRRISLPLTLGQRNALRRTASHYVLNIHRARRNSHHLVAPVDNLTFPGNENVFPLGKKNLLRFSRLIRESKKLQGNRRLRSQRGRLPRRIFLRICLARSQRRGNYRLGLRYKDVSSRPFILDLFSGGQLLQVQRRVEALRRALLLP